MARGTEAKITARMYCGPAEFQAVVGFPHALIHLIYDGTSWGLQLASSHWTLHAVWTPTGMRVRAGHLVHCPPGPEAQ